MRVNITLPEGVLAVVDEAGKWGGRGAGGVIGSWGRLDMCEGTYGTGPRILDDWGLKSNASPFKLVDVACDLR